MTLEEAVAYLKEEDLATMAVGTYEVDGNPQELYGYSVDHFRRGSH